MPRKRTPAAEIPPVAPQRPVAGPDRGRGARRAAPKGSPASTNRLPEAENSTEDLTVGADGSDLRGRKGKSLSVRERGFIRAYVSGETQGRALASARAVGFGPADSGIGSKILRRPHVKAEIARQLVAQDITAARVLAELRHVAFSDMRDYTMWGPNGVTLKASEELSDLAAAAVAEVSETEGEKSSSLRFTACACSP